MNEIELYVVTFLLFPSTLFASAGNGHFKREHVYKINTRSSVHLDVQLHLSNNQAYRPNYPDQSSKTLIVFILYDFTNY